MTYQEWLAANPEKAAAFKATRASVPVSTEYSIFRVAFSLAVVFGTLALLAKLVIFIICL
jgi:hypothetical protein